MPRPKNSRLHKLFHKNNSNQTVCFNGDCAGKVLHDHTANLERHLRKIHHELHSAYLKEKISLFPFKDNKNNVITSTSKAKVSTTVNKQNIELAIVELFTKNDRALCMIEDRAFRILVQPSFDALNLTANERDINKQIIAFSQKLKTQIIEDLKGKLLSLKIDAVIIQDLSLLGIHVQYFKNRCIVAKTLAIKELESNHTSKYLNRTILEVLRDYRIDTNQILTITADNGANMLKTDLENSLDDENFENDITESSSVLDSIASTFSSPSISIVQCGVHTLQLCVSEVLDTSDSIEKLEKCRYVSKKLRTQTFLDLLKNGDHKIPILDCVTQWTTTFHMLGRLLELKELLVLLSAENEDLILDTGFWDFVTDFLITFKPIYSATVKLQSEKLFSDLYIIIMDILFEIENLPPNDIKPLLIAALNGRKAELFGNELFNAAVFLDPRIKICLNSDEIVRAKRCITSIHERITFLYEAASNSESILCQQLWIKNEEPSSTSTIAEMPKTFSEYLGNLDPVATHEQKSLSDLESNFLMYERQQRLPLNENILDFWSNQNTTLSTIAYVLLVIPTTQINVERLFSALKYILADGRNRLTDLEHVQLVRANGIFNYED